MPKVRVFILIALSLQVSCTKDILPTIETLTPEIMDATHAVIVGNVIDGGSSFVSSRGFCWAFTPGPTLNNAFSKNSSGQGEFMEKINILPDSVYYIRAYAINNSGTAYGNEVTLTTLGSFTGSFTDERDGNSYRWVKIGDQIWMSENLAYLPAVYPPEQGGYQERFYYVQGYDGSDPSAAILTTNYQTYGALYNWKSMQSACPSGWHLPSDSEWMDLEENLGMAESELEESGYRLSGSVGSQLKSSHSWYEEKNGQNSSGLNVVPGGSRNSNGEFGSTGMRATFRTSTAGGSTFNFSRGLAYDNDGVNRGTAAHNLGLSVRCIKDFL